MANFIYGLIIGAVFAVVLMAVMFVSKDGDGDTRGKREKLRR